VVFVTKGSVAVGYRIFSEMFFGKQITMSKNKKVISVINDYSCINYKCSEFLYKAIDFTEALAMRQRNFKEVIKLPRGRKLKPDIANKYKYEIQEPLHEHRNEIIRRFQNRIDYINIEGYRIGKVKVRNSL
jgi:hypothetical protein